MNLISRIREREKLKWIKQWFDYFIEKKQNKTKQINKWHTWLKFCLPTKLLTKFEVVATKSSGPFCRQPQSDNGRFHQQTNLLTVFGPCGFNWQLVRLTSAVRRNIFQSKLNHGKETLKFLLFFVPNYSFGKLTSKTLSKTKMGFKDADDI